MVYDKVLSGKYVDLKSCTEEDAAFSLAIRNDPEFAAFFPKLNINEDQQRVWIKSQRQKEGDYFFIVWDKNGNRLGTISIYNVNGKVAESGRLAIRGNSFQVIEAQILAFRFAFDVLGLDKTAGFIYADNERAIRYNKQFGGVHSDPEINEEGKMIIKIENRKEDFRIVDKKFSSILYR